MRYHLKFGNIHRGVISATEKLFEDKPWQGSDDDKHVKFQRWLARAAQAYGLDKVPALSVDYALSHRLLHGQTNGTTILLNKYSVTTLFHEFRHILQINNLTQVLDPSSGEGEEDAQGWACSLFYTVHPKAYRRAVRRHLISGVDSIDLLHPEKTLTMCSHCEDLIWESEGVYRHVSTGKQSCGHPEVELSATPANDAYTSTVAQYEEESAW